jgi:hypothetical protein
MGSSTASLAAPGEFPAVGDDHVVMQERWRVPATVCNSWQLRGVGAFDHLLGWHGICGAMLPYRMSTRSCVASSLAGDARARSIKVIVDRDGLRLVSFRYVKHMRDLGISGLQSRWATCMDKSASPAVGLESAQPLIRQRSGTSRRRSKHGRTGRSNWSVRPRQFASDPLSGRTPTVSVVV